MDPRRLTNLRSIFRLFEKLASFYRHYFSHEYLRIDLDQKSTTILNSRTILCQILVQIMKE